MFLFCSILMVIVPVEKWLQRGNFSVFFLSCIKSLSYRWLSILFCSARKSLKRRRVVPNRMTCRDGQENVSSFASWHVTFGKSYYSHISITRWAVWKFTYLWMTSPLSFSDCFLSINKRLFPIFNLYKTELVSIDTDNLNHETES